jgi:aminopeptidase N
MAAGAKNQDTLDEGLRRFRRFNKPSDLPASTRPVIYYIGARYGTDADFKKLLNLHQTIQNADEKEEIAGALTGTKESKRYGQLFELLKTDSVRRQDLMHWLVWLLRNRYSRETAWQWLVNEWPWLEKTFASDKSYGYFARYPGGVFSRPEELKKFTDFFEPKKSIVAMSRDIVLAEAEIKSRIAWRERNEAAVREWLKKYRPKN